jgi:hypothetical protein
VSTQNTERVLRIITEGEKGDMLMEGPQEGTPERLLLRIPESLQYNAQRSNIMKERIVA